MRGEVEVGCQRKLMWEVVRALVGHLYLLEIVGVAGEADEEGELGARRRHTHLAEGLVVVAEGSGCQPGPEPRDSS